jgi:hypothetical protein
MARRLKVGAYTDVWVAMSSIRVQEVAVPERRRLRRVSSFGAVRNGFRVLRPILAERFSGVLVALEASVASLEDLRT